MANGMFDLTGWRLLTPEESQEQRWRDDAERAEFDAHWPPSQRRNRCMNCGAFMPKHTLCYTKCKVCGESYDSLQ